MFPQYLTIIIKIHISRDHSHRLALLQCVKRAAAAAVRVGVVGAKGVISLNIVDALR